MSDYLQKHKRFMMTLLIMLNISLPFFVVWWGVVMEEVRLSRVDRLFAREGDLVSWFSSVQLLFIALVAYLTLSRQSSKMRRTATQLPTAGCGCC